MHGRVSYMTRYVLMNSSVWPKGRNKKGSSKKFPTNATFESVDERSLS